MLCTFESCIVFYGIGRETGREGEKEKGVRGEGEKGDRVGAGDRRKTQCPVLRIGDMWCIL